LTLAADDPRLADHAEARALHALAYLDTGYGRNRVLTQIRLARIRFVAGEPEQACEDGEEALTMAQSASSWMVTARLRELLGDTEPYRALPGTAAGTGAAGAVADGAMLGADFASRPALGDGLDIGTYPSALQRAPKPPPASATRARSVVSS
jgi:hypothetical protein